MSWRIEARRGPYGRYKQTGIAPGREAGGLRVAQETQEGFLSVGRAGGRAPFSCSIDTLLARLQRGQ
jgi:hypothetical protein